MRYGDFGTIAFGQAMAHLAAAVVAWALAAVVVWRTSPRRPHALRDAALLAIGCALVALAVGPTLWMTADSTVDFALGQACAERGECPTRGVLASHGSYEGGVLWDWALAALWRVSSSPEWMRAAFVVVQAAGAALVTACAHDRAAGALAGLATFVVSYAAAPGFIAFHPTLAPVALTPFVWLVCGSTERRSPLVLALAGAAYGVALGVYIAALFAFVVWLPFLLRHRARDVLFVAAGFVAEQLIATPHAAAYNAHQVGLDAIAIAAVAVVAMGLARRHVLAWADARPFACSAAGMSAATILAAIVTRHPIFPFYFALLAPLIGGCVDEMSRVSRRPRREGALLGAIVIVLVAGSSGFYAVAADRFHEGVFAYRDLRDLAAHTRAGYGAAITAPSHLLVWSLGLWDRDDALVDERTGLTVVTRDDAATALCDDIHWSASGALGACEHETWVRTRGVRLCDVNAETERCRVITSPRDLEMPLDRSPIEFPRTPSRGVLLEAHIEVCPDPRHGSRTLRPLLYVGLPVRRTMRIVEAPPSATVGADRTSVTIDPSVTGCASLVARWDARADRLVPWRDEHIENDLFDQIVLTVEERRAR
ncbi:hypothetical protein [Sandaracinus amylolyticus]|uniref:Uncharacterized protein n=1 Tax=Sandaracinus amylolyticus TaxID=927083 RepID=A0A0F6VYY9_9BACT|nr:hypothetical protein [Sandaracinus amylolyticus]AKF03218.1 hypothetical protein DB32_000367 [Sandaracinus amylolyticus]